MEVSNKSEYPLVHIYPQSGRGQSVRIVGNTEGLLCLATAIIEATSIAGHGSAEVFCADAEPYEVEISRDDSDEAWSTLELPYSKH